MSIIEGECPMQKSLVIAIAAVLTAVLAPPSTGQSVFPLGTTVWDQGAASAGYTVFPASNGLLVMIDMDGTIVNTWSSPIPGQILQNGEPLEAGRVLSFSNVPGSAGPRELVELDWDGNTVWSYSAPPAIWSLHHDMERLENGNTLILANEHFSIGYPTDLEDDVILEVDPAGNVVWEWRTFEHAHQFGFTPTAVEHAIALLEPLAGDWAHANAIAVLPPNDHTDPALAAGNIVVSQRTTNVVFILDRQTGAVVWHTDPNDPLTYGNHNPTMIPLGFEGAGNILVFDNGAGTGYGPIRFARGYSRVIEIDPTTMEVAWEYKASKHGNFDREFYSDVVSGAQRLANGNTLAVEGVMGRIIEVDRDGQIVWEHMTDQVSTAAVARRLIYRAHRVPYAFAP